MPASKKKKQAKKKADDQKATPTPILPEEKDSSFDFGGLPARDLKKNLGCG